MSYDRALIIQIINDKQDTDTMLDRVVHVLVPSASEGEHAHKEGVWDDARRSAHLVVETLFDNGRVKCPRCGADAENAENRCLADGDCPVTVGG